MKKPKKNGGVRLPGIPTVDDRIGQTVVKELLEKTSEPMLHKNSFGSRQGKSATGAIVQARERCWKYNYVLDMVIKGSLITFRHYKLMKH